MSNKQVHVHLLPHGRQIKAKPGRSLMEALMDQSIFLRSDCGGKGVCKKCKVKVIAENGDSEFKKACKLIISEDISIEIPEASMLSSHIITKAAVFLPGSRYYHHCRIPLQHNQRQGAFITGREKSPGPVWG